MNQYYQRAVGNGRHGGNGSLPKRVVGVSGIFLSIHLGSGTFAEVC